MLSVIVSDVFYIYFITNGLLFIADVILDVIIILLPVSKKLIIDKTGKMKFFCSN